MLTSLKVTIPIHFSTYEILVVLQHRGDSFGAAGNRHFTLVSDLCWIVDLTTSFRPWI